MDSGASVLVADKGFRAFSPTHVLILGLFVVGAVLVLAWGRSHRHRPREKRDRRVFAAAILLVTIPLHIYELTPGEWDLGSSLPFQLCDVAWVLAVVALWTRSWWAAGFTYYVSLSIVSQGLVTPSLGQNFPDPRFPVFLGSASARGVVGDLSHLGSWGCAPRGGPPGSRSLTAGWALAGALLQPRRRDRLRLPQPQTR